MPLQQQMDRTQTRDCADRTQERSLVPVMDPLACYPLRDELEDDLKPKMSYLCFYIQNKGQFRSR